MLFCFSVLLPCFVCFTSLSKTSSSKSASPRMQAKKEENKNKKGRQEGEPHLLQTISLFVGFPQSVHQLLGQIICLLHLQQSQRVRKRVLAGGDGREICKDVHIAGTNINISVVKLTKPFRHEHKIDTPKDRAACRATQHAMTPPLSPHAWVYHY